MDADRLARLRLARTANVGPVTYRQLIQRFGHAAAALEALPDLARRGGRRGFRPASLEAIENEIENTESLGASFVFFGEPDYPAALAATEAAPPVLIVRGNIALMQRRAVAMVGARNASAAAIRFARELATALAQADFVVVSGLARGIDAAAHQGALSGGTVGVIAGGIDVQFPQENAELHEALYERGLVVAEQPYGMEPRAQHFPRRNRIISGLSAGVVVVEAAPRSGSLITARLAGEQGREVMAVPGFPLDPRARGCNSLIREGATLVQTADDIVEALAPMDERMIRAPVREFSETVPAEADDSDREAITGLLAMTPVPVDELIRLSGLSPAIVATVLLELELAGRLERHAGARVSLS